jgi:hypothetical protein
MIRVHDPDSRAERQSLVCEKNDQGLRVPRPGRPQSLALRKDREVYLA